jgi:hypothetical protein
MYQSSYAVRNFSTKSRLSWRTATRSPWNFSSSMRRREMGSFASIQPLQRPFSDKPTIDWNQNDEFFRFTRARFVSDEESEMQQRHVRFNMNELARVAARAAVSKACVNIEKYLDGMYNKVFQMTMEDGTQVVAKIPNPNAGPAHLTIASEVATMDFASSPPRQLYSLANCISGKISPSNTRPCCLRLEFRCGSYSGWS